MVLRVHVNLSISDNGFFLAFNALDALIFDNTRKCQKVNTTDVARNKADLKLQKYKHTQKNNMLQGKIST